MRISGNSHVLVNEYKSIRVEECKRAKTPYTHKPINPQTHTPAPPPTNKTNFLFAAGASAGCKENPTRLDAPCSLSISKLSFLPSTGSRRTIRGPISDKYDRNSNVIEVAGGIDTPFSLGNTFRPLPPRTKQAGAPETITMTPTISDISSNPDECTDSDVMYPKGVGAPAPAFEGVGGTVGDDWDGHSMTLAGWCAMAGLYAMDIAGAVWGLFRKQVKGCKGKRVEE